MNMIASEAVMMIEKVPAVVGKDEIQKVQESWFSDTTVIPIGLKLSLLKSHRQEIWHILVVWN
jgi:hypothetical protein